ncbi:MAG: tetraacyldisaccharide 4'-kinase, partial [Desulfatirhabdiaceae bacterium]
ITLGGTGKSPMTVYIARLLQSQRLRPAVLSRGYRGGAEKTGGVVSDGFHILLDADMAGDEPLMMAHQLKGVPVLVGKDRYRSGMKAIQAFSSNVLVLDDAFQNLRLFRDVNLVLLDDEQPFGNGLVVPAGPLREPVSALRAADAILLTRCKMGAPRQSMQPAGIPTEMPVFRSYHRASIRSVRPGEKNQTIQAKWFSIQPVQSIDLSGCRMFAFSGIARNADFRKSIQDMGCQPIGFLEYSDHHLYSPTDIEHIVRNAVDHQADMLVTTEKDACRLAGRLDWPLPLGIVGIDIELPEPDATDFSSFLQDRLTSSLRFSSHRTI